MGSFFVIDLDSSDAVKGAVPPVALLNFTTKNARASIIQIYECKIVNSAFVTKHWTIIEKLLFFRSIVF